MVDTFQPRGLFSVRIQKRRHDHGMKRPRTKSPRASQHYVGWKAHRIFLLPPVAGGVFLLTFPFHRTAFPVSWGQVLGGCDLKKRKNGRKTQSNSRRLKAFRQTSTTRWLNSPLGTALLAKEGRIRQWSLKTRNLVEFNR